jgi:hypothetical protein
VTSNQRPDSLALLLDQEVRRLPWLVPIRHGRMAESPFAYFRGAAAVMASDLSRQPHSGLLVQLCGDAHLLNFGFYASPERQLLFDINDFDETHPGPFEWDLIRLATSLVLAARSLGCTEPQQSKICRRAIKTYAEAMEELAAMPFLAMWSLHLPLTTLIDEQAGPNLRSHLQQVTAAALRRNSRQAVRKLCETEPNGRLRFRHAPPLIWRFDQLPPEWLAAMEWTDWSDQMKQQYLASVPAAQRHVMAQFSLSDAALKAVGVGSVGTRCGVSVFVGQHPDDILVLQGKQAEPSVLAPYLDQQVAGHQGKRVVQGQRLMQTASDPFLGWSSNPNGEDIYFRQFRDWKASVEVNALDADGLKDYGRLCGWTLAKAHARSGDRQAIASHIHAPKLFARSLYEQALEHAAFAEADYRQLLEAIAAGRIAASGPNLEMLSSAVGNTLNGAAAVGLGSEALGAAMGHASLQ